MQNGTPQGIALYEMINRLMDMLFTSDKDRLRGWMDQLVIKNQQASGHNFNAFIYNGAIYRLSSIVGVIAQRRMLDVSLNDQMEAWLKDRAKVKDEEQTLRMSLFVLLDPCTTGQDIRDAMPECMISCLPELGAQFQRTRPEAFTIADNDRAMRQYAKVAEKFELYAALRLI